MTEILKIIVKALPKLNQVGIRPEAAVLLTLFLVVILVYILK